MQDVQVAEPVWHVSDVRLRTTNCSNKQLCMHMVQEATNHSCTGHGIAVHAQVARIRFAKPVTSNKVPVGNHQLHMGITTFNNTSRSPLKSAGAPCTRDQ